MIKTNENKNLQLNKEAKLPNSLMQKEFVFQKIHIGMTNIVNKKGSQIKCRNCKTDMKTPTKVNTLINILTTNVHLVRNNILKMKNGNNY